MSVNVEELRLAMKITEEAAAQGHWDQTAWLFDNGCGTAGCFAGSYALHCGMQPRWEQGTAAVRATRLIDQGGAEHFIADWARARLGLDHEEMDLLFSAENTLDDLKRIVEDLCGQP